MDPDCAICRAPASAACECEAQSLEIAIRQAEEQMMYSIYDEIRDWVRLHARDYILEYFKLLTERRTKAHEQQIELLTTQAYTYYQQPPHPADLDHAQNVLKHGIDEDWRSSVQRYPEVLEYYFSLVKLTLPTDDDPLVRDPPLSALAGSRKPAAPRQNRVMPSPATTTAGAPSMAGGPGGPSDPGMPRGPGGPGSLPGPGGPMDPRGPGGHGVPGRPTSAHGHHNMHAMYPQPRALPRGRTPPPPNMNMNPNMAYEHHRRQSMPMPMPRERRPTYQPPRPPSSFYR